MLLGRIDHNSDASSFLYDSYYFNSLVTIAISCRQKIAYCWQRISETLPCFSSSSSDLSTKTFSIIQGLKFPIAYFIGYSACFFMISYSSSMFETTENSSSLTTTLIEFQEMPHLRDLLMECHPALELWQQINHHTKLTPILYHMHGWESENNLIFVKKGHNYIDQFNGFIRILISIQIEIEESEIETFLRQGKLSKEDYIIQRAKLYWQKNHFYVNLNSVCSKNFDRTLHFKSKDIALLNSFDHYLENEKTNHAQFYEEKWKQIGFPAFCAKHPIEKDCQYL